MTCERVLELLSDYLDGELSPASMAGVRSHLRRCPGCEQEHEALRRTVQLLALHGRQTVPVDCREHVLARLTRDGAMERRGERTGYPPERSEGRVRRVRDWFESVFSARFPVSPSHRRVWAGALATAAVAFAGIGGASYLSRAPRATTEPPLLARMPAPPVATIGMTQEDVSRLHRSYQFGQALGPDDGIVLVSDLVETP
jgi:anti-sigma factor RsiW